MPAPVGTATGTGGADATGGSGTGGSDTSGTGGGDTGTGGSDASGGAGGRGQSTGGAGMSNGGTSGGGCGAAAFCDDFERTMLGADWMIDSQTTANTIEISTTQHHSGTSSVHIKFGTGAMANYVDAAKGFPFPNDAFWGRVWLYAMTGLETGHHVYIEAQSGRDEQSRRAGAQHAENDLSRDQPSGGRHRPDIRPPLLPCPKASGAASSGTSPRPAEKERLPCTWTGQIPKATLTGVTIPHVDKTRLGIQRYGGGVAGELWYDDYAVGAARIGCN